MADEARFDPAYTYPTHRQHTGKIQYRTDRASVALIGTKRLRRGEVIEAKNPDFANAAVASGKCAHVDASAPVGIPDEFMTDAERKAKDAKLAAEATVESPEEE